MNQDNNIQDELLNAARTIMATRFRLNYHHYAAALRTKSGQVFSAVHLGATVGRIAVCAEAIAIGMAAAAGDTDIEMIVAVNRSGEIVAPCGMCRELIADYSSDAIVILPGQEGLVHEQILKLLPSKFTKSNRKIC